MQRGFTLLEVIIAFMILAIFLFSMLGSRSDAIVDATEARDWRLARELAEELLSELRAGARELPPVSGQEVPFDQPGKNYPHFSYRFVIGEAAIAEFEAGVASESDASTGGTSSDRLAWQRQRDQQRNAEQKGLSLDTYKDSLVKSEQEEKPPSEDEFEDVAVMVHFPIRRAGRTDDKTRDTLTLKAKVCTMAIQGLTPEKADAYQKATGKTPQGSSGTGTGGNGTTSNNKGGG
jgi:prepilin-type N-terminal cleavage/methylation domain-containing protein